MSNAQCINAMHKPLSTSHKQNIQFQYQLTYPEEKSNLFINVRGKATTASDISLYFKMKEKCYYLYNGPFTLTGELGCIDIPVIYHVWLRILILMNSQ
jgi:hypothetical protein